MADFVAKADEVAASWRVIFFKSSACCACLTRRHRHGSENGTLLREDFEAIASA